MGPAELTIFFRARLGAYFIKQEEFLVHTESDYVTQVTSQQRTLSSPLEDRRDYIEPEPTTGCTTAYAKRAASADRPLYPAEHHRFSSCWISSASLDAVLSTP